MERKTSIITSVLLVLTVKCKICDNNTTIILSGENNFDSKKYVENMKNIFLKAILLS